MSHEPETYRLSPLCGDEVQMGRWRCERAGRWRRHGRRFHAGANLMPFIGALYGWPTVVGGWVVHLLNSTLAGLLFAFVVSRPDIQLIDDHEGYASRPAKAAAASVCSRGELAPGLDECAAGPSFPEPLVPLPVCSGASSSWRRSASPTSPTGCSSAGPTPRPGVAGLPTAWRARRDRRRNSVSRRSRRGGVAGALIERRLPASRWLRAAVSV